MGDAPGHPFRGNQYTVQAYGTSHGQRYRILDPLGRQVRHLRNIEHPGSAQQIAEATTKRMLETGFETVHGYPSWDTESRVREAEVRAHSAEGNLAASRAKREAAKAEVEAPKTNLIDLKTALDATYPTPAVPAMRVLTREERRANLNQMRTAMNDEIRRTPLSKRDPLRKWRVK